jgi:hypothetical protein
MTMDPDRAMLEAYVDGALPPEEVARLEAHLARSPADRRYVEQLGQMNALLSAAYAEPMREPLPARLRGLFAGRRRRRAPLWPAAATALAASIALLIGVALGRGLVEPAPGIVAGPVATALPLHDLLEERPSGHTADLRGAGDVVLVASFLDGAGRPCREFESADTAGSARTRAVACRESATWNVLVAITEPDVPEAREDFVPAGSFSASAFDVVLDHLDAGMVLPPDQEAALIARGWRP